VLVLWVVYSTPSLVPPRWSASGRERYLLGHVSGARPRRGGGGSVAGAPRHPCAPVAIVAAGAGGRPTTAVGAGSSLPPLGQGRIFFVLVCFMTFSGPLSSLLGGCQSLALFVFA
jgi:hypothetical protein